MSDLERVFQHIQNGDYAAATLELAIESDVQSTEWWRMKALLHLSQGENQQAQAAFQSGLEVAQGAHGSTLARLHHDYGGFLLNLADYKEALLHLGQAQVHAKEANDHLAQLSLAYNLAWTQLQVDNVADAARILEEQLKASERPAGAVHRCMLHCGRSLVSLVRGDARLAAAQADMAVVTATDLSRKARGFYLKSLAAAALQEHESAILLMEQALKVHAGGDIGHRARFFLAVWRGEQPKAVNAEEQCRLLLYQANQALRDRRVDEAKCLLDKGLPLGNSFTLAQLSMLLPDLANWAKEQGYGLSVPPVPSREIRLGVRGKRLLSVNGFHVNSAVPRMAAAVLAALMDADGNSLSETQLILEAQPQTESRKYPQRDLDAALAAIRLLIGDERAVTVQALGSRREVALSPAWTWHLDTRGQGEMLGGLDVEIAQRLDDHP